MNGIALIALGFGIGWIFFKRPAWSDKPIESVKAWIADVWARR